MRRASYAALITFVTGGVLLALAALDDRYEMAFTLGVRPAIPVERLGPNERACQGPIDVPVDASRVRVRVEALTGGHQTVSVRVRDGQAVSRAGTSRFETGPAGAMPSHPIEGVEEGRRISMCLRNEGDGGVALYGEDGGSAASELEVGGRRSPDDLALSFDRAERTSFGALMPEITRRASLFRPTWVSSSLLWILAVAFLVGVPCLLTVAVYRAEQEPPARHGRE